MFRSNPSFLKLEPSHTETRVDIPFKFIGKQIRTDLLRYIGNIQMIDEEIHYMPGGFVLWRGDSDNSQSRGGWYQVTEFDSDNMPLGLATHVDNPHDKNIMMDDKGNIIYERFDYGRYDVVPGPGHPLLNPG
jgi:hypothetical protein